MANRKIIPQISKYTKVQVVSFVQMKIASNGEWAKRACLALYEHQTQTEKINHISRGQNGWGFNRNDAPILTHIACRLRQHRATIGEIDTLKVRMPKYARQLICISDDKDKCKALRKHLDIYFKNSSTQVPF